MKELKGLIEIAQKEGINCRRIAKSKRLLFYISSLQANSEKLNEALREHWRIEKSAGNVAENFAIIIGIALNSHLK